MSSQKINLLSALFLGIAGLFPLAPKMVAEGNCPPGFFPIGGGSAGWVGCAPMGPMSTPDESDGSTYSSSYTLQQNYQELAEVSRARATQLIQLELLQDPKYHRYLSGGWQLFSPERSGGIKPGEYCFASFFKASMDPDANKAPVMINLSGPGGGYQGAFLTFATEAIPRPATPQTISVTLAQNDEPSTTVKAFNYSIPGLPYGFIAFAIPTIDAALAGMEDTQHFNVKINGKSVANTSWHSGLRVRDELRRCLNGQPYSVTDIDIVPEYLKNSLK